MAKHKGRHENQEPDDETPSNTTSGGEQPTPTDDAARIDGAEGTAVYPPSPSDQSGEKTDNVAPTKKLPPDVPPEEGGAIDELKVMTAERNAFAQVVRNLGGNPDEIAKTVRKALGAGPTVAKPKGPVKKAVVTPAGGSPMEVEYPADAQDARAAALAAYKEQAGLWSMPQDPLVELK